jgi:hypothetical protein
MSCDDEWTAEMDAVVVVSSIEEVVVVATSNGPMVPLVPRGTTRAVSNRVTPSTTGGVRRGGPIRFRPPSHTMVLMMRVLFFRVRSCSLRPFPFSPLSSLSRVSVRVGVSQRPTDWHCHRVSDWHAGLHPPFHPPQS